MHYYKRNIGDYAKKAGRLSMLEHGAYTILIDSCYDREQFPTLEDAFDWAWARNDDEKSAVKFVLSKFFTLENGVYVQKRIKEELDAYKAKANTNTRVAQEREEKRRLAQDKNESSRNVNETCEEFNKPSPNQEPRTINQEPRTINHKPLLNTSSSTREDFFQEPVDNQPKFKMRFGWQVSPNFVTERKAYGFNSVLLNDQVLTEFCGYWAGKPEKLTQVEWEHKLANNLVKLTNNPVLSTGTARKSNVPDNNTTDWLTPELAEEIGL